MNTSSKKVQLCGWRLKMDSLTNFSQSPKIKITHLKKEEIPRSLKTLLSLTHIQTSALFSYF